ncbi:unnamed protein product [Acanthosepion pharaonis]|uniref:Uncharacterized protein n=1 Tax=Acanthosepion pharaonis TaxID=158019 RepID=A0A812BEL7_ACAPH|nr:unnamed protein product [Sepia pharaonis]
MRSGAIANGRSSRSRVTSSLPRDVHHVGFTRQTYACPLCPACLSAPGKYLEEFLSLNVPDRDWTKLTKSQRILLFRYVHTSSSTTTLRNIANSPNVHKKPPQTPQQPGTPLVDSFLSFTRLSLFTFSRYNFLLFSSLPIFLFVFSFSLLYISPPLFLFRLLFSSVPFSFHLIYFFILFPFSLFCFCFFFLPRSTLPYFSSFSFSFTYANFFLSLPISLPPPPTPMLSS